MLMAKGGLHIEKVVRYLPKVSWKNKGKNKCGAF
jgi:hypothetical protein